MRSPTHSRRSAGSGRQRAVPYWRWRGAKCPSTSPTRRPSARPAARRCRRDFARLGADEIELRPQLDDPSAVALDASELDLLVATDQVRQPSQLDGDGVVLWVQASDDVV